MRSKIPNSAGGATLKGQFRILIDVLVILDRLSCRFLNKNLGFFNTHTSSRMWNTGFDESWSLQPFQSYSIWRKISRSVWEFFISSRYSVKACWLPISIDTTLGSHNNHPHTLSLRARNCLACKPCGFSCTLKFIKFNIEGDLLFCPAPIIISTLRLC